MLPRVRCFLFDAIYRLRFYSNSLTHILSLSNSHIDPASIQKNRGDKSHCVIVVLADKLHCVPLASRKSSKKMQALLEYDFRITGPEEVLSSYENTVDSLQFLINFICREHSTG